MMTGWHMVSQTWSTPSERSRQSSEKGRSLRLAVVGCFFAQQTRQRKWEAHSIIYCCGLLSPKPLSAENEKRRQHIIARCDALKEKWIKLQLRNGYVDVGFCAIVSRYLVCRISVSGFRIIEMETRRCVGTHLKHNRRKNLLPLKAAKQNKRKLSPPFWPQLGETLPQFKSFE